MKIYRRPAPKAARVVRCPRCGFGTVVRKGTRPPVCRCAARLPLSAA